MRVLFILALTSHARQAKSAFFMRIWVVFGVKTALAINRRGGASTLARFDRRMCTSRDNAGGWHAQNARTPLSWRLNQRQAGVLTFFAQPCHKGLKTFPVSGATLSFLIQTSVGGITRTDTRQSSTLVHVRIDASKDSVSEAVSFIDVRMSWIKVHTSSDNHPDSR